VWVASYVALWVTVVVMALAIAALLRQIGVLHARLQPMGVHFAGEGPDRLKPAPLAHLFQYDRSALTLIVFTSPSCEICAGLLPGIRALERQYRELVVHIVQHDPSSAATFAAFRVSSTPYVVAVDSRGVVQARGVANSLEQIEMMLSEAAVGVEVP
jgi:protein-disulfide isomerase